jgi:heme/copper-type cytochrome/quinol oxidase subunit 2
MDQIAFLLIFLIYLIAIGITLQRIIAESKFSFIAKIVWIVAVLFTPVLGMLLYNLSFTDKNATGTMAIQNKVLLAIMCAFLALIIIVILFQFVFV